MGVVMRISTLVSALALGAALAAPGFAQSVSQLGGPAELPPAGYSADQYVDSRGCVFIRAGYGGQETWVPRVNRQRQALCGYRPTGGGGTTTVAASTPATPQPPAATPMRPTVTVAAAPTAPQRPVVTAQPTRTVTVRPAAAAPVTTTTVASAPVAARVSGCPGLPGAAGRFMQGDDVRCGPQATHPGDGRAIVFSQAAADGVIPVPPGYRAAWDDGRLNPYRGLPFATSQGHAAQDSYWEGDVPLTAIDLIPIIIPDPGSGTVTRASSTPDIAAPAPTASAPVVTAPVAAAPVAPSHRYVEIARYSDRSTADRARAQLAGQGVPTHLGQSSSNGALVLLAGPFDSAASLNRTLNRAHSLGYSGAVTR